MKEMFVKYLSNGRPGGILYMEVKSEEDFNKAVVKNREMMGSRFIECKLHTDF